MAEIWRYPIDAMGDFVRSIPEDGVVLHVGMKGAQEACFWVKVDPNKAQELRTFNVFATGELIPPAYAYRGTFTMANDEFLPLVDSTLVFHLHELLR